VLWGVAAWTFPGRGPAWHDLALLLIVNGLCVGSIPSLATQPRVYQGYVLLALLPLAARIALGGTPADLGLAAIQVAILATALLLGRDYRAAFERLLELKARTEALGAELRAQTEVAESARREAEAANRAKTRFFAAASHDLRQPLHAIGLFVDALRGTAADDATRRLVERLERSVGALDALFAELLDVTRIDLGGVEVRTAEFDFGAIFERLRLHFEPLAFEKGLALRLRGDARRARSDPVLVERILRNLVANAIRYTDDGGVLVAVRRSGDGLLLQVWDSGVGIDAGDAERVFDEFVRLDAATSDGGSERRKGLGMGLAIVRRIAGLLDAPLALRSTPGRGSVFSLRLPAAEAGGQGDAARAAQAAAGAPDRLGRPEAAQLG
jgi:signal transduction histidine kinase